MNTISVLNTVKVAGLVFGISLSSWADNPIITHMYTADPTGRVFNDRMYIYASHDTDTQKGFEMVDYHVFSSDDMVNWQDHGLALHTDDVPWAGYFFAPDCIERDGKYYLFFPSEGEGIGVAVSDKPYGPFKDAIGKPLVDKQTPGTEEVMWIFDPGVFIDDDGQAYLYFGGGNKGDNARVIKLKENLIEVDGAAVPIPAPDFFEASFMHKRNGKYYFSYSTNSKTRPKMNIDYMMSDDPMSGWEYKGTVLRNPPDNKGNNHHSIVEYRGQWYMFYHNRMLSKVNAAGKNQRSINVDVLEYNDDGTIRPVKATRDGVAQLKPINPYDENEAEMFDKQSGIEVDNIPEGGVCIADMSNGDWVCYSGVDFSGGGSGFVASVSSTGGGTLELLLGGLDGERAGGCPVENSGGRWVRIRCDVAGAKAMQDLYLKFSTEEDAELMLDTYQFERR